MEPSSIPLNDAAGYLKGKQAMVLEIVLLSIAALGAAIGILLWAGSSRWRAGTQALHARLDAARVTPGVKCYREEELSGLPAPAQRYFRNVLKDGQPMIAAVRIEQTGAIDLSETAEKWRPFVASQHVITNRPGFDWDAAISMMPGLSVKVHDAYAGGEGMLHASLLGLVTLAELRGSPEAAQGELLRFLGEAVWYPTALLPSQGVHWEEVDSVSARATLCDGQTEAALLIRFDENGLIESACAEARGRATPNGVIPTPWDGRISGYEKINGMLIPREAEAAWLLPHGRKPYWRGRVTEITYEFTK
jgi:hypothetical protein